jgi:hypothetical protein
MRFGQPAPGGGMFSTAEMGNIGLNEEGDVAFVFTLDPLNFGPPIIGGVYRWSHQTHAISPVVVPDVTPVPGGGVFRGVHFHASLNDRGDVAFTGYLETLAGPSFGAFVQDRHGRIQTVARPGDPAPGGGMFVTAGNPAIINDEGDVVFEGHTTVDPTADTNDVFVKRHGRGGLELIPRPAGIVQEANLQINNRGDVAFGGSLAPFPVDIGIGNVYLRREGKTTLVAAWADRRPVADTSATFRGPA